MRNAVDTRSARALRRRMTDAELKLWRLLRNRGIGVKFRRQVPIGSYVVDFAAVGERLILEIDGGQHAENEADRERDRALQSLGFRVLRFWNNEVLSNPEGVVTAESRAK